MSQKLNILFVGESCFVTVTEYKGIDHFSETNYAEAFAVMSEVFGKLGHTVTHIPCHMVSRRYPRTLEELKQYDVVLFSDVGSNTFLLLPDMVRTGKRVVNLLALTKQYVAEGGGFGMIGGYMTFQGMDAKGKWKDTHIEDILPVSFLPHDDRMEIPEGADLVCEPGSHPIVGGLPAEWPYILGYNKSVLKPGAQAHVLFRGDPVLSTASYGKGRTAAWASDCGPHWAPAAITQWEHYPKLWDNICRWLAGRN